VHGQKNPFDKNFRSLRAAGIAFKRIKNKIEKSNPPAQEDISLNSWYVVLGKDGDFLDKFDATESEYQILAELGLVFPNPIHEDNPFVQTDYYNANEHWVIYL
jgi:hypothetical protein